MQMLGSSFFFIIFLFKLIQSFNIEIASICPILKKYIKYGSFECYQQNQSRFYRYVFLNTATMLILIGYLKYRILIGQSTSGRNNLANFVEYMIAAYHMSFKSITYC